MRQFVNKGLANTVTLFNIIFGSLSLSATMEGSYQLAAVFILLAVVMDTLDGRVARRLDTVSELRKELDSLCDLVSFGVAPAILVYRHILYTLPLNAGILLMLFFIVCGAFRLARFNVLNIPDFFVGIPITSAGILMALMSLSASYIPMPAAAFIMFLLSFLMVSNIRVKKLK